ncbi:MULTISPECIES: hypothetical protein [unclassified Rhodococcus (in: high G+C Gram-positive bacteria)]|uniref:hypothetical protein n=1 Tax=unclassified Rhodococcus (in: high G+C Gram-positive bacteria) TaxID=192944 RepID=UPI00163AC362|nr:MULTISPECIES: hypothetical protein [unclassified Rhodococcus (in: high G+C Gram-positive bacteria)]MBC2644554.1 hypothetical protein [Rhodococcus sp. 3A]MBC2897757.1 hypothetical protein [Rhodococcus sp. 4CII]
MIAPAITHFRLPRCVLAPPFSRRIAAACELFVTSLLRGRARNTSDAAQLRTQAVSVGTGSVPIPFNLPETGVQLGTP